MRNTPEECWAEISQSAKMTRGMCVDTSKMSPFESSYDSLSAFGYVLKHSGNRVRVELRPKSGDGTMYNPPTEPTCIKVITPDERIYELAKGSYSLSTPIALEGGASLSGRWVLNRGGGGGLVLSEISVNMPDSNSADYIEVGSERFSLQGYVSNSAFAREIPQLLEAGVDIFGHYLPFSLPYCLQAKKVASLAYLAFS